MAARVLYTAAALVISAIGFFGNPLSANPLSLFGIMMLLVSGVVWFGWEMIRDAYAYREEVCPKNGRASLQIVSLGPVRVNRLVGEAGE